MTRRQRELQKMRNEIRRASARLYKAERAASIAIPYAAEWLLHKACPEPQDGMLWDTAKTELRQMIEAINEAERSLRATRHRMEELCELMGIDNG